MPFYQHVIRPLLFRIDPEAAHALSITTVRVLGQIPGLPDLVDQCLRIQSDSLTRNIAGLEFPNPIGLAAGWDKSAEALKMIDHMGFGFAEIGSVSARPSKGNPAPRLFRLPDEKAIIVNYGLPNDGANVVAKRLARYRSKNPIGVNVVKTNDGPDAPPASPEEIIEDYVCSVSVLHPHADYLMLNLSCPNAEGGKDIFAQPSNIALLLTHLKEVHVQSPIFLKLSPNPDSEWLQQIVDISLQHDVVAGFSFNLPPGKPTSLKFANESRCFEALPGAVSGQPVSNLINRCIATLHPLIPKGRFHIIASGGVFTAQDALEKIRLGASLVQIYTSLIYNGPNAVRQINKELSESIDTGGN